MKVLITAGPVYGRLDDNKLVGNRSRGVWALEYAKRRIQNGDEVILLVADTMQVKPQEGLEIARHQGFDDYMAKCLAIAPKVNAAIMAAAVVNWIPSEPIIGKMPTEGFKEEDIIQIPFKLAPRVIERMKAANPDLTLIGCKMLSGATKKELVAAAGHVAHKARCNAVVANDLKNLHIKHVVMPDLSVHSFDGDWEGFYGFLDGILSDVHYRTVFRDLWWGDIPVTKETREARSQVAEAKRKFDLIVNQNRAGFTPGGDGKVFGSVAVRVCGAYWLVSPREKGEMFTSDDAVLVYNSNDWKTNNLVEVVKNQGNRKATLNAPLLIRTGDKFKVGAVFHQHAFKEDVQTVPYAPPGTVRDNGRDIPAPVFNIEGHGFVACLTEKDFEK
jgi:hypothetical protein